MRKAMADLSAAGQVSSLSLVELSLGLVGRFDATDV